MQHQKKNPKKKKFLGLLVQNLFLGFLRIVKNNNDNILKKQKSKQLSKFVLNKRKVTKI